MVLGTCLVGNLLYAVARAHSRKLRAQLVSQLSFVVVRCLPLIVLQDLHEDVSTYSYKHTMTSVQHQAARPQPDTVVVPPSPLQESK